MAGRVQVISPDGVRGTVDEKDLGSLPDGARVLTQQEIAQEKLEAEYASRSTAAKVGGFIAPALPAPVQAALHGTGAVALPPELEAYRQGASKGMTGGLGELAEKGAARAVGGEEGARAYVQRADDAATASPTASTLGEVAGFGAGMVAGGLGGVAGKGAAPLLSGASALGTPIEAGVARALGGLGARGALGKAAQQGAAMAVRGAAEGAAYSGVEQATSDLIHDAPIRGEKFYIAAGHGALTGGLIGGVLGAGVSLAGSALRGLRGPSRAPTGLLASPEIGDIAASGREVRLSSDALDAGLREAAPKAEDVFSFARKDVSLRGQGKIGRVAADEPLDITSRLRIDPDAGLHAPEGKVTEPLFSMFSQGGNREVRRAAVEAGLFEGAEKGHEVQLARDLFKRGKIPSTSRPVREGFDIGLDPDAGIARRGPSGAFQGKFATEDPFYVSEAKGAPRRAGLRADAGELSPVEAKSPISLPWMEPAAIDEAASVAARFDGTSAAQRLAHDQAWKAVGAGYGLQTTRYAKEAARYFTNGTRDLGEIAMRYHLIDAGEAGTSPMAAAWQAAKTGTPADIAVRASSASDEVGSKIGAITDASGARVALSDLDAGIRRVRAKYDRIAGNDHVVNAIDNYHASLTSKLEGAADGAASLQSVLEQRKGLDEIVYRETKTLDPGRRVEALRSVRAEIESAITDALDAASGKVPGAQRAEYQALKRDYHGLRILSEAAEDSAARAAKGSTLGLTDKIVGAAAGGAAAILGGPVGGLLSGPAAGFASKLVRERGNAAAAAFLSRAAQQGMVARAVEAVDMKIGEAARSVLRLGAAETRAPSARSAKASPGREIAREQGRAERAAKVQQAQAIMKWASDHQANPQRLVEQIEEAAAIVGQHTGPKTAEAYTSSTLRAINFIVGHIPAKERRDPLDPRSIPPLSYEEADKLVRAAKYAREPMTVWADFARGKVTSEGIRAAKAFMPESYAEFQVQLMEHVQNHMLRNRKLTASQRLRVDRLLEFPAGPDLRPDTIARLQANLKPAQVAPPPAGPTGAQSVPLTVQQSGFDAIEARLAG